RREKLGMKERLITGIAHVSNVTQIQMFSDETGQSMQARVFQAMAQANISVDFINIHPEGLVYTVNGEKTDEAVQILNELGYTPTVTPNCAKVSAVGAGMTGVPGVTAKIVDALSKKNIRILQSADSHTTIWVLVKECDMVKAVNALHHAFSLEKLQHEATSRSFMTLQTK
ncbi:MAG TPA: ACT domain-containing protein, partial [Massilibacterium sp.]|nr:ACT domain-containing protein [Massilibacterium sp.]